MFPLAKFPEYKVKHWKCEGVNHIVKAADILCEKGACLPFVRNIVLISRAVITRISVVAGSTEVHYVYLLIEKSFLTGPCFRATYCLPPT
jgi:hypothetical protein